MATSRRIKRTCLYCRGQFKVVPSYLFREDSDGRRRGITCSDPCRRNQLKKWILLGMNRDKEYQSFLRERAKLRKLVKSGR